jgi:hypothetical protein
MDSHILALLLASLNLLSESKFWTFSPLKGGSRKKLLFHVKLETFLISGRTVKSVEPVN